MTHITGIGYSELHLNRQRVGTHVLDTGFTNYDKRDRDSTYDIAPYLHLGRNEIEVTLGTGWQAFDGPQIADGVYHREDYDATRALSPNQLPLPFIHPTLSAQSFAPIEIQCLHPFVSPCINASQSRFRPGRPHPFDVPASRQLQFLQCFPFNQIHTTAYPVIAWSLYTRYADRRVPEEHSRQVRSRRGQ